MSAIGNLIIEYSEATGIPLENIGSDVSLTDIQATVDESKRSALSTIQFLSGAESGDGLLKPMPTGLGKAEVRPLIPWVTIKSYVEVALGTTNLTGWTVAAIEQSGLAITWEHCLVEVSVLIPSLNRRQPPLFQIKLFETQSSDEKPLAIEFKRHYSGLACACASLLCSVVMRRAIEVMGNEWVAESAAEDAAAEALFERGETLAEEQAQLDPEELGF